LRIVTVPTGTDYMSPVQLPGEFGVALHCLAPTASSL